MNNEDRTLFGIKGIGGMLLTTVLLIVILVLLTIWGLKAQQEVMQKPYSLENASDIKMLGSKKSDHIIIKDTQ